MKKIFILFSLLVFAFSLQAQRPVHKEVRSTKQYAYNGTVAKGDFVNKNTVLNYDYYSPTLFNTMQAQVETDTVTGKPKTRLYIYQSFDYVKWIYADSATTIAGGNKGATTKVTVFAPYVRLIVKGIDSTQKTVILKVLTNLKVE